MANIGDRVFFSAGNRPSGRDQSGKLIKPDARAPDWTDG
jgi:hypothetical protein